jgi:uncharacterized membrane protein YczE
LARAGLLCVGWALVAIAISGLILIDFGVAPYDVLNVGVGELLGVAPGTAMWITGAVMVAVAWILGERPGAATPLGFLVIGFLINVTLEVLPDMESAALAVRVAALAPALLGLYTGVCLIIVSGLGAGPTEVLMLALHDRGVGLRASRWVIEIGCAGIGWILGGPVGVLTVLLVTLAAPIIAALLPAVRRATASRLQTNVAADLA